MPKSKPRAKVKAAPKAKGFLPRPQGWIGDNGKHNGNYYMIYWGYIGIMEKKTETTI